MLTLPLVKRLVLSGAVCASLAICTSCDGGHKPSASERDSGFAGSGPKGGVGGGSGGGSGGTMGGDAGQGATTDGGIAEPGTPDGSVADSGIAEPGTADATTADGAVDAGDAGGDAGIALPPDPATVASPIDPTLATDIFAATAFLYTGADPIQTGVAPGTIELRRVAVLRGKVMDRDGTAVPAVKISVLDHPELGQTLTRADGAFDLVVNGGGQLVVRYEKDGLLAIQRAIVTPWRDYAWLPDVVMIPFDSAVTTVDLSIAAMQIARGSAVSDADGTRQATILVPAGTSAEMVLPDGSRQALTTLDVRATEYTIGDSGPAAMPAALPPSSGYTYAAEFSVDQAIAADASEVRFSQALPVYVENFIGFPVGTAVPTGYYDRLKAQWIASTNGRVIKVLSITGGLADLDVDGNGTAADATALTALGVTTEERARLAQLYTAGQTLWRVPITHFSSSDFNWPYGPPSDAISPPARRPNNPPVNSPNTQCGSVIGCEDQTLGESVSVSGTPWGLHYQSGRTPGRKSEYTIEFQVSGTVIPASMKAIRVEVRIAGRVYQTSFAPAPNLTYTMTWDGRDGYARLLWGAQSARVQVSYDYVPQYYAVPSDRANSFARAEATGAAVSDGPFTSSYTLSTTWYEAVGVLDARALGMGGWSLGNQHAYDPVSRTLLLGDGRQRRAEALSNVITTVAGAGGGHGVAVGSDGSVFVANGKVIRVGPDGTITTVAGNGQSGCSGDGGPAVAATLSALGVAVAADGSLFIVDDHCSTVRRVGLDGIINTVAGDGSKPGGFGGDGGPALAASLNNPQGIALGADGSLFIADFINHRVRRVGPDGIITTVAGNGTQVLGGDGGQATDAGLLYPRGLAVGPDGSLFIADEGFYDVRRVGPDGIIGTVAGSGTRGFSGDGGPATAARLFFVWGLAVGLDGGLFIADNDDNAGSAENSRIRHVGPDGIIRTVAGNGPRGSSGDGGPATAASLFGSPNT